MGWFGRVKDGFGGIKGLFGISMEEIGFPLRIGGKREGLIG